MHNILVKVYCCLKLMVQSMHLNQMICIILLMILLRNYRNHCLGVIVYCVFGCGISGEYSIYWKIVYLVPNTKQLFTPLDTKKNDNDQMLVDVKI